MGGQGTGFFIKVDDEFVTSLNYHVIERAIMLEKNIKLQVNTKSQTGGIMMQI